MLCVVVKYSVVRMCINVNLQTLEGYNFQNNEFMPEFLLQYNAWGCGEQSPQLNVFGKLAQPPPWNTPWIRHYWYVGIVVLLL